MKLVNLEQGRQKGLLHNQSSNFATFARKIIALKGLAADISHNNQLDKSSNQCGNKSKARTILSVSVEKGIVLWLREEGKKTISPNLG